VVKIILKLIQKGLAMSIPKRFILFCRKNKQNATGACGGRKIYTRLAGNNCLRVQQNFSLPQNRVLLEILDSL